MNSGTISKYCKVINQNGLYELNTSILDAINNTQDHNNKTYYVYILSCSDGSYYTGFTGDIDRRLIQHNDGSGSTYTKSRRPVELVYLEEWDDKNHALSREKQIKKLTVFDKERLIEKGRVK